MLIPTISKTIPKSNLIKHTIPPATTMPIPTHNRTEIFSSFSHSKASKYFFISAFVGSPFQFSWTKSHIFSSCSVNLFSSIFTCSNCSCSANERMCFISFNCGTPPPNISSICSNSSSFSCSCFRSSL